MGLRPSREDVREAWHALDVAFREYEKCRIEFDRLRLARYPPGTPTADEMEKINAALSADDDFPQTTGGRKL
jgi:hypothetical protein